MDPDAQATITDFLDFTEYLPSDMIRSLTLIGNLDQKHITTSSKVNDHTKIYGKLPEMPANNRLEPVKLRADISENVHDAVRARTMAYAEAARMAENVERHYKRALGILAKLQAMKDSYPESREPSPVPQKVKSPITTRNPKASLVHLEKDRSGERRGRQVRKHRAPRITVPGEVLAPYELDYESYGSGSDISSSGEEELSSPPRRTPAPAPGVSNPKIKLKLSKTPKEKAPKPARPPRPPGVMGTNVHSTVAGISTSNALAKLKPPPPDAVPGSDEAPWLQLTAYELAKLRKRMKKNAVWSPSDTMIARELKQLGRGIEAYRAAKSRAEASGQPFDQPVPPQLTGKTVMAEGAISVDALGSEDIQLSNRGMKLNEAKKLKKENQAKELAKLAAEEAEESARKMTEAAKAVKGLFGKPSSNEQKKAPAKTPKKAASKKRKRESTTENVVRENGESIPDTGEKMEVQSVGTGKPAFKRTKTETPIPVPHPIITNSTPRLTPAPTTDSAPSVTSSAAAPNSAVVETPAGSVSGLSASLPSPQKSTTPILPPISDRKDSRRLAAKKAAEKKEEKKEVKKPEKANITRPRRSSIPPVDPTPEVLPPRRPTSSRGKDKASSIEPPQPITATATIDRPRRTSTARNTPAPETRQTSKRAKRPAPGVVTAGTEGSAAVSVGKRRAAPRKKAGQKKEKKDGREGSAAQEVLDEIDDEGNIIDPEEPRYCVCNRVSFGTMIGCENNEASFVISYQEII